MPSKTLSDAAPEPKILIVCPECGSDNVTRDAAARWNPDTGSWEMSATYEATTCEDCGHESNDHFDHVRVATLDPTWPHTSDSTWVILYDEEDPERPPEETTLQAFFEANVDGIGLDERAEIMKALVDTGTYHGGGGAEAECRLWLVPAPKEGA